MTAPSSPSRTAERPASRFSAIVSAVLIGLPVAAGLLALVHLGPLRGTIVQRYVTHPVEYAEVVLFGMALGILTAKLLGVLWERFRQRREPLPPWDGKPVSVDHASRLLAAVQKQPRSLLKQRTVSVLDFLCSRGSADQLDDRLRDLADADANVQEASHGLVKFITWALPILGFIGTVLGITEAIAGVNPEVLEKDLNAVTGGLATAFDTTGLALILTMVVMFVSFVVDRLEQGVLQAVDDYAHRQLAHRFERTSSESAPFLEALRLHSRTLLETVEQVVLRQAEVWAEALAAIEKRQEQQQLTAALEQALQGTLREHARHAAALQEQATAAASEQQTALEKVAEGVAQQTRVLAGLQAGEQKLMRMQESLDRNLNLLANAETLQQTLHSLTAAVHLLTVRVPADLRPLRMDARTGGEKAA
jgi:biopolymer transport protein ExbB/TolQ